MAERLCPAIVSSGLRLYGLQLPQSTEPQSTEPQSTLPQSTEPQSTELQSTLFHAAAFVPVNKRLLAAILVFADCVVVPLIAARIFNKPVPALVEL